MTLLPAWWQSHFVSVELALSAIVTAAFVGWAEYLDGAAVIDGFLVGNRGSVYGTLASIFGSLLGFTITAASIVLGFSSSPRLRTIRNSRHYPTLWEVFGATIRALGLSTVISLAALIVDRDTTPNHWVLYAVVFAVLLSSVRIVRTIWVLENIIALITHPSGSKTDAR